MKMKRLIALMLVLLSLSAFAACGKSDKDNSSDSQLSVESVEKEAIDTHRYLEITAYRNTVMNKVFLCDDRLSEQEEVIELSGQVLSHEQIELTQGKYIVLNVANEQGNGRSYFFSCKTAQVEYVMEALTVDFHKEGYINPAYAPAELSNNGYGYSYVYDNKMLTLEVKDINSDGYLDLIYEGKRNLINDETEEILFSESVKYQYIYNKKNNSWKEKVK